MSSHWVTHALGEIADVSWGDTKTTKSSYVPTGYQAFSASGPDGFLDHYDYEQDGVVVSAIGAQCGKTWFASGKWSCIKNTIRILPRADRADARFLYYVTCGPDTFDSRGSAQPFIAQADARAMKVLLPPLKEQRRIAGVLGALDDLIETNQRLVDRLVGLANAVFMDRFGSRSLGLTVGQIGAVVDCLHSKKPDRVDHGRLYLQLNNILDNGILSTSSTYLIADADYATWTRNLETSAWDCVITNVGRVGAVARIPNGVSAALGRNMTAIRPADPDVDGAFLLAALFSPPVRREIDFKTDSGTILSALNVRSIAGLRLPSADEDERREYHQLAAPLLLQADALMAENQTLHRTRDELLPLLLSGRVSVREVAA